MVQGEIAVSAILDLVQGRSIVELILVAIAVVGLPSLSLLYALRAREARASGDLIGRYVQTMVRGWLIAAATLIAWGASGRSFDALGLAWPPGALGLLGLWLSAAAFAFLLYSSTFGTRNFEDELPRLKRNLDRLKLAPRNLSELAVFIPVAVTAGIWEELFYRGFLMWFFAPIGGPVGAALISSLIFGAGHAYQGAGGVLRTTLVGLAFAAFYWATGSLWWLMIIHAAVDIFAGVLAYRIYSAERAASRA